MAERTVHRVDDPIFISRDMTAAQRAELHGVTVRYEVLRNGRLVPRTGSIDRIDERFIHISGWVYFVDGEVRNLRRA